jgi:hypothetical protein
VQNRSTTTTTWKRLAPSQIYNFLLSASLFTSPALWLPWIRILPVSHLVRCQGLENGSPSQGRGESVAMEGGASSEAAVGFAYSLPATLYAVRVLKCGPLPKDTKAVSENARKPSSKALYLPSAFLPSSLQEFLILLPYTPLGTRHSPRPSYRIKGKISICSRYRLLLLQ